MRTFIAIELNKEARDYLRQQVRQLVSALPHASWVDPASLHLTLAFLGELDDAQLEKAMNATQEVAQAARPFTLRIGALGTFGPAHNPRVIWRGIVGNLSPLLDLQSRLAVRLAADGFPAEERAYSPHLTLARIKAPLNSQELGALRRSLPPTPSARGKNGQSAYTNNVNSPTLLVEYLSVMKSELQRTGAQYTCLRICPFANS